MFTIHRCVTHQVSAITINKKREENWKRDKEQQKYNMKNLISLIPLWVISEEVAIWLRLFSCIKHFIPMPFLNGLFHFFFLPWDALFFLSSYCIRHSPSKPTHEWAKLHIYMHHAQQEKKETKSDFVHYGNFWILSMYIFLWACGTFLCAPIALILIFFLPLNGLCF